MRTAWIGAFLLVCVAAFGAEERQLALPLPDPFTEITIYELGLKEHVEQILVKAGILTLRDLVNLKTADNPMQLLQVLTERTSLNPHMASKIVSKVNRYYAPLKHVERKFTARTSVYDIYLSTRAAKALVSQGIVNWGDLLILNEKSRDDLFKWLRATPDLAEKTAWEIIELLNPSPAPRDCAQILLPF
jgi:hypothetical protein